MAASGFAVIELATTGLFPHGRDRLVEAVVVHVDAAGRVEGRWETLIAPEGPHDAALAEASAPTFREAAPLFVRLLEGRVLVAHTAAFGMRFLLAELERVSPWVAPEPVVLCTMQLARSIVPGAPRSLRALCRALGVEPATDDTLAGRALATARLLGACIAATDGDAVWRESLEDAAGCEWPAFDVAAAKAWAPRRDHSAESVGFGVLHPAVSGALGRVISDLPPRDLPAHFIDYLALLDRCAWMGGASSIDPAALIACARQGGITDDEWLDLHRTWFADLANTTRSATRWTAIEFDELQEIGRMLALPGDHVRAVLGESDAA